jgi:hypothetical protein
MTGPEIGNLIGMVGFPIVAVIFVALFTKNRVETSEKASERREEAALIREAKLVEAALLRENRLVERINHLEDSIRTQLVAVINQSTEMMGDAREALQQCSGTLAAAASIMQDMKDDANRRARQTAGT